MARKRTCLASSVCCSDDFLDLSPQAQALYLRVSFEADADGAVGGMRSILRMTGLSSDHLDELVDSGYLVYAEGIPFVAHWWVNNTKNARDYRAGDHEGALSLLTLGDDKVYRLSKGRPLDVQGTYEVNRIESNRMEGKGMEENSRETNSKQTNSREDAPARGEAARHETAPCPTCRAPYAITADGPFGSSFRGWCPHHGDFFIDENGEYVQGAAQ